MKRILIVLIIFLCGCSSSYSQINKLVDGKEYVIIDVRTESEYNLSHVAGSLNIPYDKINKDIDLDYNKAILVYCKSGNRSAIAYDKLKKLGYDVYDLGAFSSIDLPKE